MVKFVFEEVILDPAHFFDLPVELLKYKAFDAAQKRKILKAWELDVTLLQVCEEENMSASEDIRLLSRIHQALSQVELELEAG